MIAGTIISGNTSGTTATPTTIDVDGAGTSDAATVKGAGVITLDSNTGNSADNQIETLTLEGTSAAVTFALKDANDDPTTIVITGTQNVTISHDQASAAAHTAVTDSTTGSAVTTYSINDAFSADRDLKAIDTDVIGIGVNPDGLANHAITVKDGKTIDFEVATANQIQLDIDDGATTATTTGSLNLTFSKDITSTITIDATIFNAIKTLNVATKVAQTGIDIRDEAATKALVINLSGSTAAVVDNTTSGSELNASGLTAALTAATTANLKKVTGGSGDDTITIVASQTVTADGGAGSDMAVVAGDMTGATLSNFEVLDMSAANGAATFKSSQVSGKSFTMKGAGGNDVLATGGGASQDLSTVDLPTLTFTDTASTVSFTSGASLSGAFLLLLLV